MSQSHFAPARFITFEGIDGAGKSSRITSFAEYLQKQGIDLLSTREPGGTELAEALRELLLQKSMPLLSEILLMFAARTSHLHEIIRPALASGKWVLCDRFSDASYAYQVGGRGLDEGIFKQLEQWAHADLQPDMTFLFDLDPQIAASRIRLSRAAADRFEQENETFFKRVREAYLARATIPGGQSRFVIINSTQEPTVVDLLMRQAFAARAWTQS